MTNPQSPRPATDALLRFAARDFEAWAGLAEDTTVADVAETFEVDDAPQPATLGAEHRAVGWLTVAADGYPGGIRVWLDGTSVVLLDGPDPELPAGLEAFLHELGDPDVRLDSYLGTLPIEGSEWVYPSRGLTVYLNPENMVILRLAAYVPTTLDEYEARVRMDLQTKRLPLQRDG